ncbi:MAG: CopG family transcriptional regulator [Candidatus Dormibacteraceae bacterium]
MYTNIMERTQIYLDQSDLQLLDQAGEISGASRSALIRRAIRNNFGEAPKGEMSKEDRLAIAKRVAGIWEDRPFTGAEYVDAIRGDLNKRLRQLGLD